VLSELGQGASAVVYLGEDPFNDRKVAVKVAKQDSEMGEEEAKRFERLFLNEASLAGKLNHPNIVAVYDAVVEGDQRYIVMEYVPGGSLKKFCSETTLLPVRQAVLVIFKMCRALDYAFQNGVIHRDIKPANILLSERDEIKISDFGTAKISTATHTQIDGFLGSPAYMSPEQINEEGPSVQTDIYSLGVVMYELLTGRLPFRAENAVSMINKILNENPVPIQQLRPDLPEKLVEIVGKAMHKDPKVRYASWFEMASELANTFPQLERYSHEISSTEKFNKLRSLPYDMVKIEGEFIRDLPNSKSDQGIVAKAARLVTGQGRRTVALHVEDAETVKLLKEAGVDYGQGYYLGQPESLRGRSARDGRPTTVAAEQALA